MKRTMFVIPVDNTIDIITNSSSELFVLNGENFQTVKELLENVYPNYLSEYYEVVSLKEASYDDVETYMSWVSDSDYDLWSYTLHMNREERKQYNINHKIEQAEKYGLPPERFYTNWDEKDNEYFYPKLSVEGIYAVKNTLDPDGKMFLLFSLDENPNWEMQDQLSSIANRYHLG